METSKNNKELPSFAKATPRQLLLFGDIVTGTTLSVAAAQRNYSVAHACRLVRSEKGQIAIAKMRAEVELLLAENLASFVSQSLDIIKHELSSPLPDRRVAAAALVLRVAKPLIESIVLNSNEDSATDSVIDLEYPATNGNTN
jgi:hypothetical protein